MHVQLTSSNILESTKDWFILNIPYSFPVIIKHSEIRNKLNIPSMPHIHNPKRVIEFVFLSFLFYNRSGIHILLAEHNFVMLIAKRSTG